MRTSDNASASAAGRAAGATEAFTPVHEEGWFDATDSFASSSSEIIEAEYEVIDESSLTRPIEASRFGTIATERDAQREPDPSKAATALLPISRLTTERARSAARLEARERERILVSAEDGADTSGIDVLVNEPVGPRTTAEAFSRRMRDAQAPVRGGRSTSRCDGSHDGDGDPSVEPTRARGAHAKHPERAESATVLDLLDSRKAKLAALAAAILLGCCIGFAINANTTAQEAYRNTIENSEAINQTISAHNVLKEDMSVHTHDFSLVYATVHHDAVTHEVEHPEVYEPVVVHHTVCNECGEIVDGATEAHQIETGHVHFTTEVPSVESVLVSEAWTETVVDSESYDEQVPDRYVCSGCEEVRYVNDPGRSGEDVA